MTPLDQGVHRWTGPLEYRLHATVRGIPDPPGHCPKGCLILGGGPEVHALDASRHPDMCPDALWLALGGHGVFPVSLSGAAPRRSCRAALDNTARGWHRAQPRGG